jgi:transcriptional regulator with XRE-family HTH domain
LRRDGPHGWLYIQRKMAGLTQRELARRAGLSQRRICEIETGVVRFPTERTLRQIRKALCNGE